ncbi:MAG: hypothetical protein V1910_00540 [bacterium]
MLINNQSEIDNAYCAVAKTLTELNLEKLLAIEYQNMMDQMYTKTLKSVSEHRNEISPF